jgi:hypothetical protein
MDVVAASYTVSAKQLNWTGDVGAPCTRNPVTVQTTYTSVAIDRQGVTDTLTPLLGTAIRAADHGRRLRRKKEEIIGRNTFR